MQDGIGRSARRDEHDGVIRRDDLARILQDRQVVGRDSPVARERGDDIDFVRRHGLVKERGLEGAFLSELQSVARSQRAPFRAREELEVTADTQLTGVGRQILDGVNPQRDRPIPPHRQCIGIFESERSQQLDSIPAAQLGTQFGQHLRARE